MKKWIVFDVDDVIANFRESLHQSFKNIGQDIHWENWKIYKHVDIYNLKDEDVLKKHMFSYHVIEKSQIEEHVFNIFQRLKNKGYHIGLLTARGWHEDGLELTENFVKKHQLPVDKIVISGQHMDKKSSHIHVFDGEVVAYIDDSIHHIEDFIAQGIHAFLLKRPWNESNHILPKVNSLLDFEQQIYQYERKPHIVIK